MKIFSALICLFLSIAAAYVVLSASSIRKEQKDKSGCSLLNKYKQSIAIIIDQSDSFYDFEKRRIKLINDSIISLSAEKESFIIIGVLNQNQEDPITWSSEFCVGAKPDESLASYLKGNPRYMRQRWEHDSVEKLQKSLDDALSKAKDSQYSPISQAIYTISRRPEFTQATEKRIIIMSDMLENTKIFSLYNKKINLKSYFEYNYQWKGALSGFDIDAYQLYRSSAKRRQNKISLYWKNYGLYTQSKSWSWK